jgi:hypothetical protein
MNVPQWSFERSLSSGSNMTQAVSVPMSQCAAVRNTVAEISVPEQ